MSLSSEQKQLVKQIADETVDKAMVEFKSELKTEIIPDTVKQTLSHMGADVEDLRSLQADFHHLREQRIRSETIRLHATKIAVAGVIAFVGSGLWYYIRQFKG